MNYQLYTKLGYCTNKISERRGFFELGRIIDHKATECREKNRAASPRVRRYNRRNANDPDCSAHSRFSGLPGFPGAERFSSPAPPCSLAGAPSSAYATCGQTATCRSPRRPWRATISIWSAAPGRLLALPRRRPGHFLLLAARRPARRRDDYDRGRRLSDRRRTLGAAQWTRRIRARPAHRSARRSRSRGKETQGDHANSPRPDRNHSGGRRQRLPEPLRQNRRSGLLQWIAESPARLCRRFAPARQNS